MFKLYINYTQTILRVPHVVDLCKTIRQYILSLYSQEINEKYVGQFVKQNCYTNRNKIGLLIHFIMTYRSKCLAYDLQDR